MYTYKISIDHYSKRLTLLHSDQIIKDISPAQAIRKIRLPRVLEDEFIIIEITLV